MATPHRRPPPPSVWGLEDVRRSVANPELHKKCDQANTFNNMNELEQ
jgi:hypothetical protein